MSVVGAVFVLVLAWAAIHAIRYFIIPQRAHSLLPSVSNSFRFRRNSFSTTQVILRLFHLRLQTTAWNLHHDILATALKKERRLFLSQLLKGFYDLGSLFGIFGMLTGLVLLSWTCGLSMLSLTRKVMGHTSTIPSSVNTRLATRSLEGATASLSEYGSFIKPIIPGLTVPLAHLPFILIAVFVVQIVHEFGHAITAALESVPLLFVGASLTFVIPSAFVTLSAAALTDLTPRNRLRIIAAGPFHNILLWCIFLIVQQSGLGRVLWAVGYRDLSAIGKIVVRVDSNSPLHTYLPPATIITKLDDTFLGSRDSLGDVWTSYLSRSGDRWEKDLGWCVEALAYPELCCTNEKSSRLSCFISTDDPSHRGCLDPIPILTVSDNGMRCSSTANCSGNSTCVRPDKTGQLLRLAVHQPSSSPNQEDIILWNGPLREVWEQIDVGTLMPRLNVLVLPLWLPTHAQTFWEYLIMATLSLYVFNLLPLPLLDGSQFLRTLIQMALGYDNDNDVMTDEYDLEASELPRAQPTRSRRNVWESVVPKVTMGLFSGCIVLAVIDAIL